MEKHLRNSIKTLFKGPEVKFASSVPCGCTEKLKTDGKWLYVPLCKISHLCWKEALDKFKYHHQSITTEHMDYFS